MPTLSNLRVGTQAATRAYLGANLVWGDAGQPPAAGASFVAASSSTISMSATKTAPTLACTAGDVLIAVCATSDSGVSVESTPATTPPDGTWTRIGTKGQLTRIEVFVKVATGPLPATTWTWAQSHFTVVGIAAYRGVQTPTVASMGERGSTTTHTTPAVTVPTGGMAVQFAYAHNGGPGAFAAGPTTRVDVDYQTFGNFAIADSPNGAAVTYSNAGTTNGTFITGALALQPAHAAPDPDPDPPPPDPDPPVVGTFDTGLPRQVFSSTNSFWYKPLPAGAPLDPASSTKRQFLIQKGIEHWGNAAKGFPSFALNHYTNTPPIVVVDNNTPIINGGAGMTLRDTGTGPYFNNLRTMFQGVRLPANFVHDVGGSDGFLIVYNKDTDTYWDFWVVQKDASGWPGWSANRGHRIENASTKTGITEPYGSAEPYFYYGSNAAGLAEVGGVIKVQELEEGVIPHVINMAVPVSCVAHKTTVGISAPATRSDGASLDPGAIQMGQRIRLPAGFDVDTPNYHPVTRAVARAFRDYGAIVMDRAGDISFRGENRTGITDGTARWASIFAGASPHDVMWDFSGYTPFPWSSLQVLAPNYLVP